MSDYKEIDETLRHLGADLDRARQNEGFDEIDLAIRLLDRASDQAVTLQRQIERKRQELK